MRRYKLFLEIWVWSFFHCIAQNEAQESVTSTVNITVVPLVDPAKVVIQVNRGWQSYAQLSTAILLERNYEEVSFIIV